MNSEAEIRYNFDTENGNFYLYDTETGKNWDNYLWNKAGYCTQISHTGLISSRLIDEKAQIVVLDAGQTSCLYIRDEETGDYWNPGFAPSCNRVENYECVHGQCFTKISSERNSIFASVTIALSDNKPFEVWKVSLKNIGKKEREISTFAAMEFDVKFEQPAYYYPGNTSATCYNDFSNAIVSHMVNPYQPHNMCDGFIASSEKPISYEGYIESFYGTSGSPAKPYVLENKLDCSCSQSAVRRRGGVLQNKFCLSAGEEKTLYYFRGFTNSPDALSSEWQEMLCSVNGIFDSVIDKGLEKFGGLSTVSPDERINRIMNFWASKQVSYCMIGKKAVRDNAQVAMGLLNFSAMEAKKALTECVCQQFLDGHSLLTWSPLYRREKEIYSDPSAWLILAVCELIKETGDISFLNETYKYVDGGEETIEQHLDRAVSWLTAEENFGVHGLPRIHHADWNDALNIPDNNAESVFMGMLICTALSELKKLYDFCDLKNKSLLLEQEYARISSAINKNAWNGEYYIRALSKFGSVGDKDSKNGGNIYINPQTWSILSDVVPDDRLESVLKTIDSMETADGIPLCSPPYKKYDSSVGRMSAMPAGVYENGGIYNHASAFKVMADCHLGRASQAVSTLLKMIPDGLSNPSVLTTTEPYVFTNCYLKHKNENMKVGFSWQTGSSAWGLRDYYEGILGIIRTYEGIMIKPCIPENWNEVSAERFFRGNKIRIKYKRVGAGNNASIKVDGKSLKGNIIPAFADLETHTVDVEIG